MSILCLKLYAIKRVLPDLIQRSKQWVYQRGVRQWCSVLCLICALVFLAKASYIHLKAQLAQVLIAQAYAEYVQESGTLKTNTHAEIKPWPWADMHVLAKLSFGGKTQFIVSDASMRNLAFAPAHLSSTSLPGETGNTVIFGHRDTHFNALQHLKINDKIQIEVPGGTSEYVVSEWMVIDETQTSIANHTNVDVLTLVTCYPFNGIEPDTSLRYVVRAIKV